MATIALARLFGRRGPGSGYSWKLSHHRRRLAAEAPGSCAPRCCCGALSRCARSRGPTPTRRKSRRAGLQQFAAFRLLGRAGGIVEGGNAPARFAGGAHRRGEPGAGGLGLGRGPRSFQLRLDACDRSSCRRCRIFREEIREIPDDGIVILATGPLTSPALSAQLAARLGEEHLYFYDAISPIVTAESIDMSVAYRASRYDKGGDDYLNLPMTREEYYRFHRRAAQRRAGADA